MDMESYFSAWVQLLVSKAFGVGARVESAYNKSCREWDLLSASMRRRVV
jgi:hypothetical protein